MSSQRKILKNLITNALISSSMATCMLTTGSAFASGSPTVNRTASGVAANLFTGVGLDSGVAFNPVTSVLTINNVDVNTGGIDNIPSIFSLNPQTLNVDNNLTLGAVGGARLNLNITGDYLITWNGNGVSATAGANTKDQAGNASPFGEVGGPYGLDDNTFSVGNMNFNNKVATFDIYTTNNGSIIDQNTVFQQAGSATLSVTNTIPDNGTTILHPSVTQFDTLQINGTVTARLLPNIAGDFNAYPADLNVIFNPVFFNKNNIIDARFGIGNSDTTGGALNPRSYTADPGHTITSGTDGYGLVAFNSGPNGQQRIVDINVGTNNSQRLGQVTIEDIQGGQTGIITVNGTMFAQTILLATNYNAGNGIIWTSAIDTGDGGVVKIDLQSNVLFQNNITSNINFVSNDASFVTMDDGFNVTGNIYKTGTGATTLNFAGISTVTGDIGGNNGIGDNNTGSYPIDVLNIQGDDTTTVELKGNTTVNQFNFTDTGMAAVGGTLTATVGVNFNNVASTLQFNGALGAGPYTFSSPVLNAANGILDVYTNLITTDASIGTLATINIGDVGNKIDGTLTITVPGDNFVLGGAVDIDTAGSQLIIAIPEAQTVTFNQNVTNTTAAQGGSVTFDGTNGELVVDGAATIGAVNNLNAINTKGAVQVQPGLNVGGTAALNLKAGSTFTDNSLTSTNIAAISIGEAGGVATYALDAINDAGGAFNLNTGGMTFGNAASILQLQSSALAGADTTITLLGNLNPGNVGGAGGTGIIAINAINAGETLKIAGAGSLGIAGGNLLQQMTFAGAGNITVVPTINTANAISTGITGTLTLGTVNSNINFTAATNLIVGNVTGNIGLAGQAGIVTLLNNSTITGTVDGSTTAILNFQGAGNVGAIGANNTLTAVNFQGAGDVNLTGVANATNFSITNGANVTVTGLMTGAVNYGAGAGALTLQSGLNGAITTSVPNNGTVTINGGNISGIIDGTTLVNIGANPVTFSANVNSTTVALTNNASSLTIGNNVTLTSAVTTANPNNGVLILNPNSSVVGDIGTNLAPIAAVQIGAGPASLQGNVYSGAAALTNALSSLTLNAGTNVNGSITNTSGNNNSGILIFNGGSITGAAGAPGAALSAVTFNANGALPIASYAQTFNVNNAAVANAPNGVTGDVLVNSGTYIGNIAGNATFGGVGTITTTTITGQTNFNGLGGTVTVNDTGSIGAVTSSGNNGNLIFAGGANVTGIVSNIGAMTLNGAAGSIVNFQQNVSGASLALNNGGTANLSGSLTTTGNVDFNKAASILRFSGGSPAGYQLNSPIANANNGVLNVFTNLTATDPTIGQIKTITIGNGAAQIFTISTSSPALTLLQPAGSTIIFGDAGSTFAITSSQNQGVAFANSFDGFAGGGGILQLGSTSATTPNNNVLYLQGTAGTEAIGSKANQLTSINIVGNVGIAGISPTTKQLDVSNTKALNISAGSVFADESITSAQIKAINIGDNTGAGTYALDAVNADFTLQAAGVTFGNEDSVFKLMTSATAANSTSTIILDYNIVPLAPHTAIVELNAKNPGVTLKIEGTANKYSLGTKALPLKQINFSGNGLIAVEAIATDTINISVPKLLIGEVNSNIIYSGPTELGVVTVNGDMDFQNNAGTAVFASDTTNPNNIIPASISGDITSTGGPGPNGTVIAMDNLTVGGTVTNINSFQGGADGSTVTFNAPDTGNGVTMSATELKGTGAGTMVLAQNTTFTGNINESSDAKPVNLEFPNGGTILGNMGNGAPVGNVTVTSGTLNLGVPNSVPDSVMRGDTLYVDFNNASVVFNTSDILFSGGIDQAPIAPIALRAFVPGALVAPAPIITGKGAFFKDTDPVITSAPIGKTAPIPIYIQGGDVTLTNNIVNISSANFTTPNAVTLTINSSNAQLGGATTNADDLHTIAISGDLTTGKNPFGDPTNSLKSVKLLTSGKITIDSENFYSGITTGTNNTGTAVFDADNGFTDDLGEESARLDTVQFNSVNGKVKGDTYSKTITIDSGKSAIFAGYKDRTLDVPAANVNGTQIPRSIQKFKYNTVVAGDSFIGADASSNGTFSNPALVQVPINKGTYKFDNDVWLQKPLTGASDITFAPNRVSIIGAEVEAVNIGANQANLVFLASAPLSGNISGSNMTLDLGNNQITYTGNAKPTGELTINVLYDTVNSGAKNNTDSGNIVIANGSNIDLSGVTALKVLLTAASNAASISENSAYPIITSLSGNGITVGNAGKLPFNVTANEGVFVRWVINASSFTLYPIESTGDVVTDNIIKILINTPIGNVIVNTPVDQRKVIVDHLIPIIPLPSNEVHKITQVNHPFIIPEIPSIAPIGGYSPSVPVNGPAVVGTGPNGPNSPVIGGSVIGGTFTPSGPSVVYPSGPAVVGTGPNGPNVPSAPSTVTPGTGGVTGYSPSTP
ncbi:beta strand repeat-containing protein, partial [Rickettsia endosymbiont of Halotydeus destructor]|uniref:beta strand repeat-containing protein n=1 Tax=Rickettsia endosymbiont of Halotydeus destructor TaxID=2996754 RepID=UPI003BAFF040